MNKISVIIPARNEPYLQKTIDSILKAAKGEIEVITVLDGCWPEVPIQDNPYVKQIHFSESRGMRASINAAARIAQGEYLLKCDAHCLFDKGFDEKLKMDCKSNWTVVPVRYSLDVKDWMRKIDKKYEFEYISRSDLKGRKWPEYAERVDGQKIVDLMTSQGSCWFMYRDRFWKLGGLDEVNYGHMGREAQEVCLKTWLSGGRYVLNRDTWYAHWSKGRGNPRFLSRDEKQKSVDYAMNLWLNDKWPLATKDLQWLVDKFAPVPTWERSKENEISKKENAEVKEDESKKDDSKNSEQVVIKSLTKRNIKVVKMVGMNRAGLYRYFASLSFNLGLEVGVQRARNAWVMFENIPGLRLYLVDPYKDNGDTQRQWGERFHAKARKVAHQRLKDRNVVFIEDTSLAASKKVPEGSLDFVYIDGEHSYDYVMMDIQLWSRKVKKGGIVSGHDYHLVKSNKFKVEDAVDDFVRAHNITLYITDESAKELPGDGYASWFWMK